ncbi:MAG TPA: hypothetical protein VFL90_17510, partial [Methylomirabilota bacterium]|nr:hypothetical protein [Methylomirabilota bacterium]
MRRARVLVLVASALACGACGELFLGMSPGGGVVLDTETDKPIAGAAVTLDCQRQHLHGSSHLKDVTSVADAAGRYVFSFWQVARCDLAYPRVAKDGYTQILHNWSDYRHVPDYLYLTPLADAGLRRLREEARLTAGRFSVAQWEYLALFGAFYKSKRMAATDREREFVAQTYCPRLLALYERLTPTERATVATYSAAPAGGQRIDHQAEVEAW